MIKPIMVLPLFVWLSREMEEFYPISHYPMYATVDSKPVWYIYLADADALDESGFPKAIPMEALVGVRPARAKKTYQTNLKKHAKEIEFKDNYYELPDEEWQKVGEELLAYFRGREEVMKTGDKLPDRFALVFVEITIRGGDGVPRIEPAPGETEKELNERREVIALEVVDNGKGGDDPEEGGEQP